MIYHHTGNSTTRTRWRTMTQVKRWATRYGHAWEVNGANVVVSCADGTIHVYSHNASPAGPAEAAPAPVRDGEMGGANV